VAYAVATAVLVTALGFLAALAEDVRFFLAVATARGDRGLLTRKRFVVEEPFAPVITSELCDTFSTKTFAVDENIGRSRAAFDSSGRAHRLAFERTNRLVAGVIFPQGVLAWTSGQVMASFSTEGVVDTVGEIDWDGKKFSDIEKVFLHPVAGGLGVRINARDFMNVQRMDVMMMMNRLKRVLHTRDGRNDVVFNLSVMRQNVCDMVKCQVVFGGKTRQNNKLQLFEVQTIGGASIDANFVYNELDETKFRITFR